MAQAQQHGEMMVKCNMCGKDKKVKPAEYYKQGGMSGGCCSTVVEDRRGQARTVYCTYSTVSPGTKLKTHKASRDRKGRGSMKG